MEQCASRELQEESGLIAEASSLKRMGYLVFKMIEANKNAWKNLPATNYTKGA